MRFKIVGGRIGCRKHFDVEAFEQRARGKVGLAQASFDLVVHAVGIVRTGAFTNAKELHQLSLEPQSGGCRGEHRKVLRKAAPDGPSIRLDGRAIARGHTQVLH